MKMLTGRIKSVTVLKLLIDPAVCKLSLETSGHIDGIDLNMPQRSKLKKPSASNKHHTIKFAIETIFVLF